MRKILRVLFVCLGLLALQTQAREVNGVKYEESIALAGSQLQLNGAGTRYKAVFKVYTAGLYLGKKAATMSEIVAMPGPKRLTLTMLRDINGEELGRMFIKGIKANTSNEAYGRILPGVLRMSQIFYDFKRMKVGETITMDWVPGTGTIINIRGVSVGEAFKEPEYYSALLGIWLGEDPAYWTLKEALLGKAESAN